MSTEHEPKFIGLLVALNNAFKADRAAIRSVAGHRTVCTDRLQLDTSLRLTELSLLGPGCPWALGVLSLVGGCLAVLGYPEIDADYDYDPSAKDRTYYPVVMTGFKKATPRDDNPGSARPLQPIDATVVDFLNRVFTSDPAAVHLLLLVNRHICTGEGLLRDPYMQVHTIPALERSPFVISGLGFLNGVMAAIGQPEIYAKFREVEDSNPPRSVCVGFGLGSGRFSPEPESAT